MLDSIAISFDAIDEFGWNPGRFIQPDAGSLCVGGSVQRHFAAKVRIAIGILELQMTVGSIVDQCLVSRRLVGGLLIDKRLDGFPTREEMVALWEKWAKQNDVAFPKRFNMYEFLREKRERDH